MVKYPYSWSYRETVRLVLRWLCQIYVEAVPDASTLDQWAQTLRPETVHVLNDRGVHLAPQAKVTKRHKLPVDGTEVETTIR